MYSKQDRKYVKAVAKDQGIHVFCSPVDGNDITTGVAVAFEPAITNSNCRMLNVSAAFCAPEDKYSNKWGKFHARRKLLDGQFITLPLAEKLRSQGPHAVGSYLLTVLSI